MRHPLSPWRCLFCVRLVAQVYCYLSLLLSTDGLSAPANLTFTLQGKEQDWVTLLANEGFVPVQWQWGAMCAPQPLVGEWLWYAYPSIGQVRLHVHGTGMPDVFTGSFQIGLSCQAWSTYGTYSFDPLATFRQLSEHHLSYWHDGHLPTFYLHATKQAMQSQRLQAQAPPPLATVPQLSQLWHSDQAWPCVALTFDACSTFGSAQLDTQVLLELLRLEMPSTVFLGGIWAQKHATWVKWLSEHKLFEIGVHGYSHQHMIAVSLERVWSELASNQAILFDITGRWPTLFRPPYGEISDDEVRIAAQLGMATIQYDITAGDADRGLSAAKMAQWVDSQLKPGSIVVLHMNRPGGNTAEALPLLAQAMAKRHLKPCHVSQLLASYWHHATCDVTNPWDRGAKCQMPARVPQQIATFRSIFRRR